MVEKKTAKKKSFFEPIKEETNKCPHTEKCSGYPKLCSKCKKNPNKSWYEVKRGYFTPNDEDLEGFEGMLWFPRFSRMLELSEPSFWCFE